MAPSRAVAVSSGGFSTSLADGVFLTQGRLEIVIVAQGKLTLIIKNIEIDC